MAHGLDLAYSHVMWPAELRGARNLGGREGLPQNQELESMKFHSMPTKGSE